MVKFPLLSILLHAAEKHPVLNVLAVWLLHLAGLADQIRPFLQDLSLILAMSVSVVTLYFKLFKKGGKK